MHLPQCVGNVARVVEFMLLDPLFPHSVFYSLKLAERNLDELFHNPQNHVSVTVQAQRVLGQDHNELKFMQPGVLLETLDSRSASLPNTCRDVGEALVLQYLHATPWVAWSECLPPGAVDRQAGESLMWRMQGGTYPRIRLRIIDDRLLQRSPADAAI